MTYLYKGEKKIQIEGIFVKNNMRFGEINESKKMDH